MPGQRKKATKIEGEAERVIARGVAAPEGSGPSINQIIFPDPVPDYLYSDGHDGCTGIILVAKDASERAVGGLVIHDQGKGGPDWQQRRIRELIEKSNQELQKNGSGPIVKIEGVIGFGNVEQAGAEVECVERRVQDTIKAMDGSIEVQVMTDKSNVTTFTMDVNSGASVPELSGKRLGSADRLHEETVQDEPVGAWLPRLSQGDEIDRQELGHDVIGNKMQELRSKRLNAKYRDTGGGFTTLLAPEAYEAKFRTLEYCQQLERWLKDTRISDAVKIATLGKLGINALRPPGSSDTPSALQKELAERCGSGWNMKKSPLPGKSGVGSLVHKYVEGFQEELNQFREQQHGIAAAPARSPTLAAQAPEALRPAGINAGRASAHQKGKNVSHKELRS